MVAADRSAEPRRHLLTVEDVERMVAVGVIAEDARVELIDGELIDMVPINPPHAGSVIQLTHLFGAATAGRALVSVQNGVQLDAINLPQPDLALLRLRDDFYKVHLPTVEDVLLVVEVSDTTLNYDRTTKATLYAARGVPELWVFDVKHRKMVRFRTPAAKGYRRIDEPRGSVAPKLLPSCAIDLTKVFPR
jgi:Uma2 family endonuclease